MEKDKKVTALYCRLSKDDGSAHESLSIRTQKAMLMEYATRNGFGNCQYYVDDGYSGTNSDRPAFQELLDDIRDGKVATVITKDQSRLGRNHIETGTYMEIFFPEHGVRYIAINDGYDSNEQSQMDIAPFRNIINEMYAKDTSRKIKSALRTRKKSGKYISSGAPFGYQKDPADHNHLVIDPNTAPVVEYLYSLAEEGLGLHRIAKRLHDEKILKPCYYKKEMFGRFVDDEKMYDWDSAYVSQILHSPVYAGHIIYEAKPTVSMKSKKRRYIPFEERAIVPNTHEAIIPQDRWENVQRILYSRSGSFMCDKTEYDNIFKGIVRCAANDSFEDVVVFGLIAHKTTGTAIKDSLHILPTVLWDDCFMRVRNNSTFFKRDITSLLGFHGHSRFCFIDDVSGVDRAVQNLTDIGRIPIIHLFIIDKATKHLFFVVARLQDFLIVKPFGDTVKPKSFLRQ